MTDRILTDLAPELQPLAQQFIETCQSAGIHAIIDQTYRSSAEQDADYASGRTAPGNIITNAKGGQSPHNCTLADGTPASRAFDFAIEGDNGILDWDASDLLWQKAISIGESLGLVSGSTFCGLVDNPHFEMPNWKTLT